MAKWTLKLAPKTNIKSSKKGVPKIIRSKIDWERKTGQVPILHPPDPKPREGIKGWVNPSFRDIGIGTDR